MFNIFFMVDKFSMKTIPHLTAKDGSVKLVIVFNLPDSAPGVGEAGSSRNSISGACFTFRPAYLPLVYRPKCRAFHPAGFSLKH